jgi:hypothetical protein
VDIKLKVTREKFDEFFSIDDWFNLDGLTNKELYERMLNFVVDADGKELTVDEARQMFKQVKKKDWTECVAAFYKSVGDAFVSPTNGGS